MIQVGSLEKSPGLVRFGQHLPCALCSFSKPCFTLLLGEYEQLCTSVPQTILCAQLPASQSSFCSGRSFGVSVGCVFCLKNSWPAPALSKGCELSTDFQGQPSWANSEQQSNWLCSACCLSSSLGGKLQHPAFRSHIPGHQGLPSAP